MDSFQVKAKEAELLKTSHLIQEMQAESSEMQMFPVLIDEQVGYFHDIDGGYSNDHHIVNLIHRVQGPDSPPNKIYADTIELHLADNFYHLDVADIYEMDSYPDDDYVLSLKVTDYMIGEYSFSEAMSEDIDKREQEFGPNGEL